MNVIPAWRKGYSGKGIVVSILDDGIQTNHPDLAQNYVSFPNLYYYSCCCSIFKNKVELSSLKKQNKKSKQDPLASSDINDNDNDPMPRDNGDNKHGTRCAGEVAAVAFNSYCGVGIAFNASIGGTGTYLYYLLSFESSYIVRCSFDFRRANVGRNSQRCCRGSRFEPQSRSH